MRTERRKTRASEEATTSSSLEAVLRRHVELVVARSATFSEAAQQLGINLTTLWRMRKRWGLD